jgi:pimeloyl-ACP methyl ester carboxylesterase
LPLDYDRPHGATTEVALLRYRARDPKHRIGSLFVNPGGPGGSGTSIAAAAPSFLPDEILNRFDVVGFDPRGTNFSDRVACFRDNAAQSKALKGFGVAFPVTKREETAQVASARNLGRACSTTGRPLSASMSTAEVARDMDVLRRAVGDRKLTYLGFSYGTYLGQVYANLFPDRFRALAIDGVVDPTAWRGTPQTASRPQTDRLRSADGAYKALHRILVLCDRAGGEKCRFAGGNPSANFDLVAQRLKRHPLVIDDPDFGPFRFGYAELVANTLSSLYDPVGFATITDDLEDVLILTEPPAGSSAATRQRAARALVKRVHEQRARQRKPGLAFPYENDFEAFASVLCTDGANPADAASWPAATAAADRRAKYFGRIWAWSSVQCASRTWKAHDEDAYQGSFRHRTSAPVLVVGSTWDPATNIEGAVTAARLLPNSRLLRSDNWGHTAYGTSDCATGAIDAYLLRGRLPKAGKVCHGDVQPFEGDQQPGALRGATPHDRRAPVVPPIVPALH